MPLVLETSPGPAEFKAPPLYNGAHGRNRTVDTGIFSPMLYLLSYMSISARCPVYLRRPGLGLCLLPRCGFSNAYFRFGAPSGNRTRDTVIKSHVLYHLSYRSILEIPLRVERRIEVLQTIALPIWLWDQMVPSAGVEPTLRV